MKLSYFTDLFTKTAAQANLQQKQGRREGFKVAVVCVTAAVSLSIIEYLGKFPGYLLIYDFFRTVGLSDLADNFRFCLESHPSRQLNGLAYWVCVILLGYVIIPVLVIKLLLREKIRDYGFRIREVWKDWPLYALMLVFMIPVVIFFSGTESFQLRYPFYRMSSGENLWPNFWIWQLLYFFQFIGVEFFFRGFLTHGLKIRLGYMAVFVMVIPYCMIHFGKPFPETIAAIIAGVILGTLSLKSRSIWLGIMIHYSVAILMDLSALWSRGYWAN